LAALENLPDNDWKIAGHVFEWNKSTGSERFVLSAEKQL